MRASKSNAAIACVLAAFALTGAYLLVRSPAQADDSAHTTSLVAGMENFDGSNETAVIASFTSTDNNDARLKVSLFVTPHGVLTEEGVTRMETSRQKDGALSVGSAVSLGELSSGDVVRGLFEAFDSSGSVAFSYSRTYSVP